MDKDDALVAMKLIAALSSDGLLRNQLEIARRDDLPQDIITILEQEFQRRGLAIDGALCQRAETHQDSN